MWFGHWRKGAAATLGEEHEQVFATVSKYGTVIRHMTKASMCKQFKILRKGKSCNLFFQKTGKIS